MNDREFTASNKIFCGVLKTMRRAGMDKTTHKMAISDTDIKKMYASEAFDQSVPMCLIYKVYFELSLHFARRGREGLRELTKSSFIIHTDENGEEYVEMAYHEVEKKKQGDEKEITEKDGCMYSQRDDRNCPVKSLKLLLSKLNPKCSALFQYPISNITSSNSKHINIWFQNKPIGRNVINDMMKKISTLAGLSKVYTNHCVRVTCITALARAGVDSTTIIALTGHKSADSLKPYLRGPSQTQKKSMSNVLHGKSRDQSSSKFLPAAPVHELPTTLDQHVDISNSETNTPKPASDLPDAPMSTNMCERNNTHTNISCTSTDTSQQLSSLFAGTTFNAPVNITINTYHK